jgi:hypothetical protein
MWVFDPVTKMYVDIDPATGLPLTATDLATTPVTPAGVVPGVTTAAPVGQIPVTRQAPLPPREAANLPIPTSGYIPGSTYVPPVAASSLTTGVDPATGLPIDPLGNGPYVPGDALPVAGGAPSSDYGYDYGGYGGGGYSRGSYGGSYGGYSQSGTVPRYGNNAVHPFFGGPPLVAGGVAAQQGDGYDNRQQVTSTSGASAGPYGVRAARMDYPNYDGYAAGSAVDPMAYDRPNGARSGGGGGGGGGGASDAYWNLRGKLMGKATAMTGGGSTASYSDDYETFKPYRGPDDPRTARRIEQLDPRMRGPYASQFTADNARALYQAPGAMYKKVSDLPYNDIRSERIADLPMDQLALLTGSGTKNWQGGLNPMEDVYDDYYKKLNKRLNKGKPGIDFLPFYKKNLKRDSSLSDYTNTLGGLYDRTAKGGWFDRQQLFGNLTNPAKGTYFHDLFAKRTRDYDVGAAADGFTRAFNAILATTPYDAQQQRNISRYAKNAVDEYIATYSKAKPKNAPSLNQYVGSQLTGYVR